MFGGLRRHIYRLRHVEKTLESLASVGNGIRSRVQNRWSKLDCQLDEVDINRLPTFVVERYSEEYLRATTRD